MVPSDDFRDSRGERPGQGSGPVAQTDPPIEPTLSIDDDSTDAAVASTLPGRDGHDETVPRKPGFPPAVFDEYRLIRELGRGAMGAVYLAHDTLLERQVAIKFVLRPNPVQNERFLVEARAMARFQHPNIATIYRVGEYQARPYIVSEYIHGRNLQTLSKPIAWQWALELG
ncbi:MAG: protein kinase, partial [Myxococcota bacterium]